MNPVQALRTDLRRTGVPANVQEETCTAYAHALVERTSKRWENFYRTLFDALHSATAPAIEHDALRSLLLILEDDLGVQLFRASDLHVLRSKLGISDACAGPSSRDVSIVC